MKIYQSLTELIGNTPLLQLREIERKYRLQARLLAKVEAFNPAGSAKDRVAREMLASAEKTGALKSGGTVIEPTSGNTGIGLCAVAISKGYRVIIVMPNGMSKERYALVRAYGAELVLTDGKDGMAGAIARAEQLHGEIENSIVAGQFTNPANPAAHYNTTAPEIWADTDGEVDIFVAGVGTGGTLTGVGRFLKEKKPSARTVAVEPASSAVLSGSQAGAHAIQGIGAGFVPATLDRSVIDEVIAVTDENAMKTGRELARSEGLLAGISSGAALWAAIEVCKRKENAGKTVVVLLPDTGDRYLSTALFEENEKTY